MISSTSSTSPVQFRFAIVDDHDDVRSAVSSLLRSYGYATTDFDCAESLLAAGAQHTVHCIISDLQMPGMSGLQLLEHLRRNGCAVPLIMLTAFPEPAVRQRAQQGGAAAFLSKPFQGEELINAVVRACEGSAISATSDPVDPVDPSAI
ncbi:response regulator transcription factor [Pseudoduganella sp. UC29_71]|uniref:response regulator transcription factor n=1 Tax=Pseudoduganella sp. UC29_71 TaxID=3350174 RepID=UPI00367310DF